MVINNVCCVYGPSHPGCLAYEGGNDLIIILANIHDLHTVYEYNNFIY